MADRLSELPDSLLSLILSKLPIADAVGCSILSKRWRFLYTEMPHLLLSPALLIPTRLLPPGRLLEPSLPSMLELEMRISDILRLHSSDLDTFSLSPNIADPWNSYTDPEVWNYSSAILWEWLECVARKNVQRLFLKRSSRYSLVAVPPPALFSCSRLTTLTLCNYNLTDFPTDFLGFRHLTECTLVHVKTRDESLARFLSLCPLLQKFNLERCVGLQRPVISALNLTYLTVVGCHEEGLTVNCPNLKTLKPFTEDLKVNGMRFEELSPSITGLEMEGGSNLIGLSLDSVWCGAWTLTTNRFLEIMGTLGSLKVLAIDLVSLADCTVVPLFNLLSRLPNLERLRLFGRVILEEPERDPTPPFLMSPLLNLQSVEIQINEYDERNMELRLLGCLVQIAPALKEVKLWSASKQRNLFLEKWQSLKKSREEDNITETRCEFNIFF